jgi:hypothetical protein
MKKYLTLAFFASGVFTLNLDAQSLGLAITNNLFEATGVAVDATYNYYVADSGNNRIMRYNPVTGALSSLAGAEDGSSGTNNGTGILASFFSPQGIVFSAARGGLVVSDSASHTIRLVTTAGVVTTLAGQPGISGSANGGHRRHVQLSHRTCD